MDRIAVPERVVDHPGYRLHPALLDTALRRLVAAAPTESAAGYLPASVAAIRVYGPIGREVRCHVRLSSHGDDYLGRVMFTDDAGIPVAELTGIQLRPVDPGALPLPLDRKLFGTEWRADPESGEPPATGAAPDGNWLLLVEPDSATESLAAEFTTRFSTPTRRVIAAELSDAAPGALDPETPLAGVLVFIDKRSFDSGDPEGAAGRARQLIWTISTVTRAAVDRERRAPRLWLVTRNGLAVHDAEPGDPVVGALKGLVRTWRFPGELARVLADEPDVDVTLIDLDEADGPNDMVATLTSELGSTAHDDVIAWRQRRRFTERLTRAALGAGRQEATVRTDGSYILTGGLGGLGAVVARWLVGQGAGRLILNGRSDPSEAQRGVLAELEAGAEIAFVRGDISSPGVAERLVAAAEETGRPLRGVIHAAGVLGDGLVTSVTPETLHHVWAAKAVGALRLHAATATRQLDWWVGFSSMAALLGLPGQLGYATANAWLDALVAWRRAAGLPATAIDWGQWSDVGIGRSMTLSLLDPISPDEGIEALQALIGGAAGRVGVGRLRLDRAVAATPEFRQLGYFEEVLAEFDAEPDAAGAAGRANSTVTELPDWSQIPAADRLAELVSRLRVILARELRTSVSAVDVEQPFPELGLDSMMAMTVLKETQRLVGIDLSASMFWNHPTVSALAAYLVGFLAPPEVPDGGPAADADHRAEALTGSSGGVLDELFDSVESASAGSESGFF